MKKTYQGTPSKSEQKFAVIGNRELLVEMPLPLVEVWEELQSEVEHLTGLAGLKASPRGAEGHSRGNYRVHRGFLPLLAGGFIGRTTC